jgi:hypothetical protein
MKLAGWHVGMAQRQVPWLQIPLHAEYHVGNFGIDYGVGVLTWEARYGAQVAMLDWVDTQLGYPISIWELAKRWQHMNRSKSAGWSRSSSIEDGTTDEALDGRATDIG